MATLFHVRPPSTVWKILVILEVEIDPGAFCIPPATTHAILEESAAILTTRILSPEEFTGVKSLQEVPPSLVRSST
jgi:hypothetical protein